MTDTKPLSDGDSPHNCNEHLAEVDGWGWECTVCFPDMLKNEITLSITGCARCHSEGHTDLKFRRLTHPVEGEPNLTHWATCPCSGEPILLAITEKAAA